MILKDYQRKAIKNLEDFLRFLDGKTSIDRAFKDFWESRDRRAGAYKNNISGVPQVCFKVPTGGGKTFMAAASLKPIFEALPAVWSKVVVWLVPSETILTQTYKNLNDVAHPYRRRLDEDFSGQVAVYSKEQLLMGENFSPAEVAEQLSVLVLSYDSFRTTNREGRRAYRQNGQLQQFAAQIQDEELLSGAEENSLIQVIRHYRPLIIVDESHHATTELSVDMLKNFNPSFVLELTATPRDTSNVIAYVSAAELKNAAMVKLPVMVYNRRTQEDVIKDAIDFRNLLEAVGQAEGIRPIILFQAETQGSGERATFDKIKSALMQNYNIPAEEIAIKTAEINELRGVDLLAGDCPVRHIITINALKEGWDCPFAYILASLANRNSLIDVEQILGRILRRPRTKNFSAALLNRSYVFTSSNRFGETLNKIVTGLNTAGFTEREYHAVDEKESRPPQDPALFDEDNPTNDDENFSAEEREQMNFFKMRDQYGDARELLLPQFFIRESTGNLFGDTQDLKISPDTLKTNFSLADKDSAVDFDNLNYEIASIDVHATENVPRYKYLSDVEVKVFLEYFDNLAPESQRRQCVEKIVAALDKDNTPSTGELIAYVARIVSSFSRDRIREAVQHTRVYAEKINDKLKDMMTDYARKNFLALIAAKKIFAKPSYKFPEFISPLKFQSSWENSLYSAEEEVNGEEYQIVAKLSALENVLWWHRDIAKKGFCLNGFINHYPDFVVKMKSGVVVLVEYKGDDRDNSDSRQKLELGKIWEAQAGADKFSYFMVFKSNPIDGALSLDEFVATMKKL